MKSLKLTLKAWPVIAAATIGLCYLTQTVAGWFGIELPDQANIDLMKRYAGWNLTFLSLCVQVIVLMPAIEEVIFRWLLWRLPVRTLDRRHETEGEIELKTEGGRRIRTAGIVAVVSSAFFSGAHYFFQPFPDSAFIALVFFGLAQCWLYLKTDHLWCAMLNHGLFNLTNLVLLFILPNG